MKKIIDGKMYNTDTAKAISIWNDGQYGGFNYIEETLFKKRTGEYFLYGFSGALGKYREQVDTNSWSGGSKIIPYTETEAKRWLEKYGTADEYIAEFGEPEE